MKKIFGGLTALVVMMGLVLSLTFAVGVAAEDNTLTLTYDSSINSEKTLLLTGDALPVTGEKMYTESELTTQFGAAKTYYFSALDWEDYKYFYKVEGFSVADLWTASNLPTEGREQLYMLPVCSDSGWASFGPGSVKPGNLTDARYYVPNPAFFGGTAEGKQEVPFVWALASDKMWCRADADPTTIVPSADNKGSFFWGNTTPGTATSTSGTIKNINKIVFSPTDNRNVMPKVFTLNGTEYDRGFIMIGVATTSGTLTGIKVKGNQVSNGVTTYFAGSKIAKLLPQSGLTDADTLTFVTAGGNVAGATVGEIKANPDKYIIAYEEGSSADSLSPVGNGTSFTVYIDGRSALTGVTGMTTSAADLVSITAPANITAVTSGVPKTAAGLGLPAKVSIVTDPVKDGAKATVNWNVDACSYDPAVQTVQNFIVAGTVVLPSGISNSKNVDLTLTVNVAVDAFGQASVPQLVEPKHCFGINSRGTGKPSGSSSGGGKGLQWKIRSSNPDFSYDDINAYFAKITKVTVTNTVTGASTVATVGNGLKIAGVAAELDGTNAVEVFCPSVRNSFVLLTIFESCFTGYNADTAFTVTIEATGYQNKVYDRIVVAETGPSIKTAKSDYLMYGSTVNNIRAVDESIVCTYDDAKDPNWDSKVTGIKLVHTVDGKDIEQIVPAADWTIGNGTLTIKSSYFTVNTGYIIYFTAKGYVDNLSFPRFILACPDDFAVSADSIKQIYQKDGVFKINLGTDRDKYGLWIDAFLADPSLGIKEPEGSSSTYVHAQDQKIINNQLVITNLDRYFPTAGSYTLEGSIPNVRQNFNITYEVKQAENSVNIPQYALEFTADPERFVGKDIVLYFDPTPVNQLWAAQIYRVDSGKLRNSLSGDLVKVNAQAGTITLAGKNKAGENTLLYPDTYNWFYLIADGYYKQSAGVQDILGVPAKFVSVIAPQPITNIPNGSTNIYSYLPRQVGLVTAPLNPTDPGDPGILANVTWDWQNCSYDSTSKAAQTFDITGTIQLVGAINYVTNPDNLPLTVTISVTVMSQSGPDPIALTVRQNGQILKAYTLAELKALGTVTSSYTAYNTFPSWQHNLDVEGVKVADILANAHAVYNDKTLLKFTASDGFSSTMVAGDVLSPARYYFPHGNVGTANAAVGGDAALEGKLAVPATFAVSDTFDYRLLFGQKNPNEQTYLDSVRKMLNGGYLDLEEEATQLASIDTSTPANGSIVKVGEKITFPKPLGRLKIYYTMGVGTAPANPTLRSTMYNISDWGTPDAQPVISTQDKPTIIKTIVIGMTGLPSEVKTFTFNPKAGGGGSSSSGGGGGTTAPITPPVTSEGNQTVVTPVITGGKATASVAVMAADKAVLAAKNQPNSVVEFKSVLTGNVTESQVVLPASSVQQLAAGTDGTLKIATGLADLTIPNKTLDSILANKNGDLTVSVAKVQTSALSAAAQKVVGNHPVFEFKLMVGNQQITDFNGQEIQLSIPYQLAVGENPDALIIYFINSKGEPEMVTNCTYDAATKTVKFAIDHFSIFAVGYHQVNFNDLAGHWAAANITSLAAKGIVSGNGDGNFKPDALVTRAEFIKMLFGLSGAKATDLTSSAMFADVAANQWYAPYVTWAVNNKIAKGITATQFAPTAEITREQMATMLANFVKAQGIILPVVNTPANFADNSKISAYAQEAVSVMQKANVINGKSGNLFDPAASASRAEAAKVIDFVIKTTLK